MFAKLGHWHHTALALVAAAALSACGGGGGGDSTDSGTGGTGGTGGSTLPPQVTVTVSNAPGTVSGSFVITLEPTKRPITTANFLKYVNDRFYDGTIFHRYTPVTDIANFAPVIEGGAYLPITGNSAQVKTPTYAPIALEPDTATDGLSNTNYTVAMSRSGLRDSATSGFFINLSDNNGLLDAADGGYAMFGTITSGREVVDAMKNAACVKYSFLQFLGTQCTYSPNMVIVSARQTR